MTHLSHQPQKPKTPVHKVCVCAVTFLITFWFHGLVHQMNVVCIIVMEILVFIAVREVSWIQMSPNVTQLALVI